MTLVRATLRLASLAATLGWFLDGLLRRLARGAPPTPFSSLVVIDAPIPSAIASTISEVRTLLRLKLRKARLR